MALNLISRWIGKRAPAATAVQAVQKGPLVYETFYKPGDSRPWVSVTRDGKFIDRGPVPGSERPPSELEERLVEGTPEIAPGRWLLLSHQGEFKSVFRPENGTADYVVKIFNRPQWQYCENGESGSMSMDVARESAEKHAALLRKAYGVIGTHIGAHLLKVREVKVGPFKTGMGFCIYKLQDYGDLTSPSLIQDESLRDNAIAAFKAARAKVESATDLIRKDLYAAGIDTIVGYIDVAWDFKSGRPVVYDILDSVGKRIS